VELVEDNFSASWTAASNDVDRGQEVRDFLLELKIPTKSFSPVLLIYPTSRRKR
jgi:hypothetical protein